MKRETRDFVLGMIVMVIGLIILFAVLFLALNMISTAGDYFREQLPEDEKVEGPYAEFRWDVNNFTATFEDLSDEGDGNINEYDWDFGDGEGDNDPNPTHPYANEGNYQVTLTIRDSNGKRSSAQGDVNIVMDGVSSGRSHQASLDFDLDVNFNQIILPIALAILVGSLFLVLFLVGGAITKAGWNILKPKPEKLKIKLKPREMTIQQVGTGYLPQRQPEYVQQPPPQYREERMPPPPEE